MDTMFRFSTTAADPNGRNKRNKRKRASIATTQNDEQALRTIEPSDQRPCVTGHLHQGFSWSPVGIPNTGQTCFLNSIIQSFMCDNNIRNSLLRQQSQPCATMDCCGCAIVRIMKVLAAATTVTGTANAARLEQLRPMCAQLMTSFCSIGPDYVMAGSYDVAEAMGAILQDPCPVFENLGELTRSELIRTSECMVCHVASAPQTDPMPY